MKKIPIDIKELLDATGLTAQAQSEPVRVAILVDVTAPQHIVDCVRAAFYPLTTTAFLHIEAFDDVAPVVHDAADLALIIAGASPVAAKLHSSLECTTIPTLIVTESLKGTFDDFVSLGSTVSPLDIVSYSVESDAEAPSDRLFLNKVADWIVEHCSEKRLAFAAGFEFIRRPLCLEIIKSTAFQNGAVGAILIIPGADMPVMTLNQIRMVLQIAAAYGQKIGMDRVKEIAVVVGSGFAFRAIARQAVGLVPALGWAVKAGVGYSGTIAMGRTALEYFEQGGNMEGVASKVASARDSVRQTISRRALENKARS